MYAVIKKLFLKDVKQMNKTKIVIRGKLPSLNEVISANRSNKYAGSSQKKKVENNIIAQIKSQTLCKFERISISFTWYEENKKRDFDNVASAVKFILDSLVKCEVIPNDGWKHLEPELNHRFFVDKENPRCEIEITESCE